MNENTAAVRNNGLSTRAAPMKREIVLVHNTAYYLKLHYLELIRCLLQSGWSVCCAAPRDDAAAGLEDAGARFVDINLSRRGMNPLREAVTIAALYRILNRLRPDAVLNFSIKPSIYCSIAAWLAGVPRIFSMITGLGYVFLGDGPVRGLLSNAVGWGYRVALSGNQRVFFQNPDDRDYFSRRRIVKARQAVVLNGTGVDTKQFQPPPPSSDGLSETSFLMIGRLLSDKGVREFAAAARMIRRRHPRIRCALLGPRDDNPSVVEQGEIEGWTNDGIIDYLGETEDVAAVIARYTVFVLPSYREGLPRATLEAMAMGRPVITTNVPGCRETVVEGVNGFLVPPRDAEALAVAMERFVNDPDLVGAMGRASRKIAVDKYDVHIVNREILYHLGIADENR